MVQFNDGSFDYSKVKKPGYVDVVRLIHALCTKLTSTAIVITVVFGVASYIFGLGEWRLADRELIIWFRLALYGTVILAILSVTVGETAKWLCLRAIHILFFVPALKEDFDNDPVVAKSFNAMRTRYLISAACSFLVGAIAFLVLWGMLAEALGGVWADVVCLLVVSILPTIIAGFLSLPVINRAVPSNLPPEEREDYRQVMWWSDEMTQRLFKGC